MFSAVVHAVPALSTAESLLERGNCRSRDCRSALQFGGWIVFSTKYVSPPLSAPSVAGSKSEAELRRIVLLLQHHLRPRPLLPEQGPEAHQIMAHAPRRTELLRVCPGAVGHVDCEHDHHVILVHRHIVRTSI